jgi:hypothetical protein
MLGVSLALLFRLKFVRYRPSHCIDIHLCRGVLEVKSVRSPDEQHLRVRVVRRSAPDKNKCLPKQGRPLRSSRPQRSS